METPQYSIEHMKFDLEAHKIDFESWKDDPNAKSIEDLFSEVQARDIELVFEPNINPATGAEFIRPEIHARFTGVDVYSQVGNTVWEVYEDHTILHHDDGLDQKIVREPQPITLGLKLKRGEHGRDIAYMLAIQELEDLWLANGQDIPDIIGVVPLPRRFKAYESQTVTSIEYPGLTTVTSTSNYEMKITKEHFIATQDLEFKSRDGNESKVFKWRKSDLPVNDKGLMLFGNSKEKEHPLRKPNLKNNTF